MLHPLTDLVLHRTIMATLLTVIVCYGCHKQPISPPPVVVLTADCGRSSYGPVERSTPITLFGTSSKTPNPPLVFAWTFGDGTSGTGITPTHTYQNCHPDCSGPQCTGACLGSRPRAYPWDHAGCCPKQCPNINNCGQMDFTATLTVTDAAGGSAKCQTLVITTGAY